MQYLTSKEIAQKWGIDSSLVLRLAREGRIEGAVRFGKSWMFPADAQKPADGRSRQSQPPVTEKDSFRFPLFVNHEESSYNPPLSDEELALRQGQIAFYACRFEESNELLAPLAKNAQNRYVRIAALFQQLITSIYLDSLNHTECKNAFLLAMSEDFPHKEEMLLLQYSLCHYEERYKNIVDNFRLNLDYPYHPSAYPTMAVLTYITETNGDLNLYSSLRLDGYELSCKWMEEEGCFFEAQELHFLLLQYYQMIGNKDKMTYHLRHAMRIAADYDLTFLVGINMYYYPEIMDEMLNEYPRSFVKKMHTLGDSLQEKYLRYAASYDKDSYLGQLAEKEYAFVAFAVKGYSNKEIARLINVSEKTVSRRYDSTYTKLGVTNKNELAQLVTQMHFEQNSSL